MLQLLNDNWTFRKTVPGTAVEEVGGRTEGFAPVELPHDWLIYDSHRLYEDGCGWYRRSIVLKEALPTGERIIIRFEGVYMDSTTYVNGQKAGEWKYGYSTFDVDITEYLVPGENELLVQVRFQAPNSRWYSGAGIYRNVWLQHCKSTYLPLDGTYVTTKACPEGFLLEAETEIGGVVSGDTLCHYALYREGSLVQELGRQQAEPVQNQSRQERNREQTVPEQGSACLTALVAQPLLWDIENPVCYELVVTLYRGDELLDEQRITIGFRTMEFDPDRGFILNGRQVKVHGVCEHHDFGCLGAAFNRAAMQRKFRILRGMGVNAIRPSHNMPAVELMELADEMGFLVMNEAFDMWERTKTTYDYGRFFKEWAERDVRSWIRRDRNHPSLMLWSIGNEIYDTHVDEHGQEITRRLIDYVRDHDPKHNAEITIGSNYMPWENARKCADIVKIAGYNYGEKYYDAHHREYQDWVIYGSETASIVQSRGIYHFPLSQSILADEDEQCSALGNSATSWGARSIEKCITDDRDATYAFGQFLWTGFDYIGEPTPYHTKNSYFGQVDTAGFPKDSYYIFAAEWTDVERNPMVHLFPYWDFNEGQLIDVRVCTNAPYVELFVNGISQGRQRIDHEKGSRLLGDWQVAYTPGIIEAVAYDEQGRELAREARSSFGDSQSIAITADRESIRADAKDLSFLTIQTLDAQGRTVDNAVDYVRVEVEGPGRLLGLDNGDSTDYDSYKSNVRKLFSGKLLAVIASTGQPGEIIVRVSGEGLQPASISLQAVQEEDSRGAQNGESLENCAAKDWSSPSQPSAPGILVRKIALHMPQGQLITPEQRELTVEAEVYPKAAGEQELIWKVVNDGGIDIAFASIETLPPEKGRQRARITAYGDGNFRVRCMTKGGREHISVISQIECVARGLGQAFLNPYDFISAGLYSDTVGEVGNGNEKGIATARDGVSGVVYTNVDMGEYGSDEITMPVFALSDEDYPIEIWLGKPNQEGSRLLDTVHYQKPSLWNVYQEETWKLPERIKGVVTLAFVLKAKVHIKGFSFTYYEKAFGRLHAGEADKVYGDSFLVEGNLVTGIGNNVTLEYANMNFGAGGAKELLLCGHTPLAANTIHIHFTDEAGNRHNRIVEFAGTGTEDYSTRHFSLEPLQGKGIVEFIFLPGSSFDFSHFQFS